MTTLVDKRSLVVQFGANTVSSCRINIFSDYPQPVKINVDGINKTILLRAMGEDAAAFYPATIGVEQAGYYAHYEITGLRRSHTQYKITATQEGTPQGTLMFIGNLRTAPGPDDRFAVVTYSCSGRNIANQGGGWNAVKRYAELDQNINPDQVPLSMVIGVDDIGYIDSYVVDDTAYSIPHNTEQVVMYETDYVACVKWLAWAGMMNNTASAAVESGREFTHTWCNDNLNQIGIWGDHEIFNDVGYGATSGTYRLDGSGTSIDQTVAKFKTQENAWDIFFAYRNGPGHFNLDGNEVNAKVEGRSRAFAVDVGPIQFIALDRNYGDMSDREGNGKFIYSQAQIDGARVALESSDARFRIVGSAHRYRLDSIDNAYDIADDDNAALGIFTDPSMSLMKKHNDDGSKFLIFQGDNHSIEVRHHGKAQAGRLTEQFLAFNIAGMRTPQGGMSGINFDSGVGLGWYDFTVNDYLPPVGAGVDKDFQAVFDNTVDKSTPKLNIDFEAQGEGVFLLHEFYFDETPARWVVSIIWGGSNKRQQVYEYIDDGGDNLPSVRRRMSIR